MVTVTDAFYRVLRRHGVTAVFGNPGSNELSFLTGLPDDIPYYLVLQEGAAIAIADGYAQASGTIGFLNLHAASGTGNSMGCMTNTADCHTPMVIMAGQQARRYVPVGAMLTNVDPVKLGDPLVKWSGEPLRPQDGPALVSKGLMLANSAPRGVVYLSVPWTTGLSRPRTAPSNCSPSGRSSGTLCSRRRPWTLWSRRWTPPRHRLSCWAPVPTPRTGTPPRSRWPSAPGCPSGSRPARPARRSRPGTAATKGNFPRPQAR